MRSNHGDGRRDPSVARGRRCGIDFTFRHPLPIGRRTRCAQSRKPPADAHDRL